MNPKKNPPRRPPNQREGFCGETLMVTVSPHTDPTENRVPRTPVVDGAIVTRPARTPVILDQPDASGGLNGPALVELKPTWTDDDVALILPTLGVELLRPARYRPALPGGWRHSWARSILATRRSSWPGPGVPGRRRHHARDGDRPEPVVPDVGRDHLRSRPRPLVPAAPACGPRRRRPSDRHWRHRTRMDALPRGVTGPIFSTT